MIDENDLRARLHAATDHVNPTRALAQRVDRRIEARRRWTMAMRAVTVTASAAVLVTGLALLTVDRAGDPDTPIATATPRSNTPGWTPIAAAPIEARFQHTSIGMDEGRVLVFGGYTGEREARGAAIYEPTTGRWTTVDDPPGDVGGATAAWTGAVVLVLDIDGKLLSFDPATHEWTEAARSPFTATANAVTKLVWSGHELVVVNSASDRRATASYDPKADRWRSLDAPPHELAFFDAVWTGREVLAAADVGASEKSFPRLVVLALDPDTGDWRELDPPPLVDAERRSHGFAVWTGSELIVGGGRAVTEEAESVSRTLVRENRGPTDDERRALQSRAMSDVAAYDPATDAWRRLPDAPQPVDGVERYADIWTGDRVLVWSNGRPMLLDPDAGQWTVGPELPGGYRQEAPAVWTGRELVVWSGEPTGGDTDPMGCCRPSSEGFAFTP